MLVHKNKIDLDDFESEFDENKESVEIVDTLIRSSNLTIGSDTVVAEPAVQNDHADKRLVDPMEYRVQQVHENLELEAELAWFLAAVFNPSFYQANSTEDLESLDAEALFTDYLKIGLDADVSPSPAIDLEYIRKCLRLQGLLSDSEPIPIMEQWLKHGFHTTPGHAWFDSQTYLEYNPDVVGAVSHPYYHFAIEGIYENRVSCELIMDHVNVVYKYFSSSKVDMELLFGSIPTGFSEHFLELETQQDLKNIFMPDLYRAQIDANIEIPDYALYSHFILFGLENRSRPTALFHDHYYLRCLASYEPHFKDTDELQEFSSLSDKYINTCKTIGTSSPFFHWFFKGMSLGIVPTPLFSAHP